MNKMVVGKGKERELKYFCNRDLIKIDNTEAHEVCIKKNCEHLQSYYSSNEGVL